MEVSHYKLCLPICSRERSLPIIQVICVSMRMRRRNDKQWKTELATVYLPDSVKAIRTIFTNKISIKLTLNKLQFLKSFIIKNTKTASLGPGTVVVCWTECIESGTNQNETQSSCFYIRYHTYIKLKLCLSAFWNITSKPLGGISWSFTQTFSEKFVTWLKMFYFKILTQKYDIC